MTRNLFQAPVVSFSSILPIGQSADVRRLGIYCMLGLHSSIGHNVIALASKPATSDGGGGGNSDDGTNLTGISERPFDPDQFHDPEKCE